MELRFIYKDETYSYEGEPKPEIFQVTTPAGEIVHLKAETWLKVNPPFPTSFNEVPPEEISEQTRVTVAKLIDSSPKESSETPEELKERLIECLLNSDKFTSDYPREVIEQQLRLIQRGPGDYKPNYFVENGPELKKPLLILADKQIGAIFGHVEGLMGKVYICLFEENIDEEIEFKGATMLCRS